MWVIQISRSPDEYRYAYIYTNYVESVVREVLLAQGGP